MPSVILRIGYACAPRRRAEVLAALRVIDGIGAPAGWPSGRYLFVDTRSPGEPDLEVEYAFASLADLEQREARLRELLRASARDGGPDTSTWQSHLLASGVRRFLTLLDDQGSQGRASTTLRASPQTAAPPRPRTPEPSVALVDPAPAAPTVAPDEDDEDDEVPDDEPIDLDPSSLMPDGSVPPALEADERRARLAQVLKDSPGLRQGFSGDELRAPTRERRT